MTDKLPEWPEKPEKPEQGADVYTMQGYWMDTARAALARMEALTEVVREYREEIWASQCEQERLKPIDELLAACERKEAGR